MAQTWPRHLLNLYFNFRVSALRALPTNAKAALPRRTTLFGRRALCRIDAYGRTGLGVPTQRPAGGSGQTVLVLAWGYGGEAQCQSTSFGANAAAHCVVGIDAPVKSGPALSWVGIKMKRRSACDFR